MNNKLYCIIALTIHSLTSCSQVSEQGKKEIIETENRLKTLQGHKKIKLPVLHEDQYENPYLHDILNDMRVQVYQASQNNLTVSEFFPDEIAMIHNPHNKISSMEKYLHANFQKIYEGNSEIIKTLTSWTTLICKHILPHEIQERTIAIHTESDHSSSDHDINPELLERICRFTDSDETNSTHNSEREESTPVESLNSIMNRVINYLQEKYESSKTEYNQQQLHSTMSRFHEKSKLYELNPTNENLELLKNFVKNEATAIGLPYNFEESANATAALQATSNQLLLTKNEVLSQLQQSAQSLVPTNDSLDEAAFNWQQITLLEFEENLQQFLSASDKQFILDWISTEAIPYYIQKYLT